MGKAIGVFRGCATLLMPAHVLSIQSASQQCDHLIVLLASDDYIEKKKGYVPLNQDMRKILVEAIKGVDEVHVDFNDTEQQFIYDTLNRLGHSVFHDFDSIRVFHSPEMLDAKEEFVLSELNKKDGRMLYHPTEKVPGLNIPNVELIFMPKLNYLSTSDLLETIRQNQ